MNARWLVFGAIAVAAVAATITVTSVGGDSQEAEKPTAAESGVPVANDSVVSAAPPPDVAPLSYREVAEFITRAGGIAVVYVGRSESTGKQCHGLRTDDMTSLSCGDPRDPNGVYALKTSYLDQTFVSGIAGQRVTRVEARASGKPPRVVPMSNGAFFFESAQAQTLTGFDGSGTPVGSDAVLADD
jgi:hypothetical protein